VTSLPVIPSARGAALDDILSFEDEGKHLFGDLIFIDNLTDAVTPGAAVEKAGGVDFQIEASNHEI
jgi:hypothetical protein